MTSNASATDQNERSWTVAELARGLGLSFDGDGGLSVRSAAHPSAAGVDAIALAMDPKYVALVGAADARAAVLPPDADWRALGLEAAIFAPRARFAMAGVTAMFGPLPPARAGAHPTALVSPDARVDDSAEIGPFAIIEDDVEIGPRAVVGAHVTVGRGARIAEDVRLAPGVRIRHAVTLGARVIVHENAVIGSDGFSFVTPEADAVEIAKKGGATPFDAREGLVHVRIHSIAGVQIDEDVEIGANTAIDRGTVAPTRIGRGTKIDNLVQIGHNVVVGENCLICGLVGIAGSAKIGDRCVLGGQSGVGDHSVVGDDVLLMATSAVSGNVKGRQILGGSPALPRDEATRIFIATKKLPRALDDLAALKKRLS